jgi:hypothetical protein
MEIEAIQRDEKCTAQSGNSGGNRITLVFAEEEEEAP